MFKILPHPNNLHPTNTQTIFPFFRLFSHTGKCQIKYFTVPLISTKPNTKNTLSQTISADIKQNTQKSYFCAGFNRNIYSIIVQDNGNHMLFDSKAIYVECVYSYAADTFAAEGFPLRVIWLISIYQIILDKNHDNFIDASVVWLLSVSTQDIASIHVVNL